MTDFFAKTKSPMISVMTASVLTDIARAKRIVFNDFFDVEYDSTIDGNIVTLKENQSFTDITYNSIKTNIIDTNASNNLLIKADGTTKLNLTDTENTLFGTTFVSGTLNATSFAFGGLTNANISSAALIDQTKFNSKKTAVDNSGNSTYTYAQYPNNVQIIAVSSSVGTTAFNLPSGSVNVGINFRVYAYNALMSAQKVEFYRASSGDKINTYAATCTCSGSYHCVDVTCVKAISPANVEWNIVYLPKA